MQPAIFEITAVDDERIAMFASLTDNQLRNRKDPMQGIFVAESPKVIRRALKAGCEPISLLCERKHIAGDAADIVDACNGMMVYTGSREVLSQITGYKLTRGVLCAMRRPPERRLADLLNGARRVAILDGVCDTTNVGAIFRSAAALGIDAVLLTPTACDPLNRRVVRVSMGNVFEVPWARIDTVDCVKPYGFKTVALALTDRSVPITDAALNAEPRLALVLGTEGDGLDNAVIGRADYTARIQMARDVDSLNVAVAAAVAFWQLRTY